MDWIALQVKFNTSTIVDELPAAERMIFLHYLLGCAEYDSIQGRLKFLNEEALARRFNCPVDLIKSANLILQSTHRIRIEQIDDGYYIYDLNWQEHQKYYLEIVREREQRKRRGLPVNGLKADRGIPIQYNTDNIIQNNIIHDISGIPSCKQNPSNQKEESQYVQECLSVLQAFSKRAAYPFDPQVDADLIRWALEEYRNLDTLREIKKWTKFYLEHPEPINNPNLTLRNLLCGWFKKTGGHD